MKEKSPNNPLKRHNRAYRNLRAGVSVGPWILVSRLGEGGNGEVWRARREGMADAALKLLKETRGDRYERFRSEIHIQQKLSGTPGVLPVVDAYLPATGSEPDTPAWLATKLAQSLRETLTSSDLSQIVERFIELADCLVSLAAKNISHRDIKPDNLFLFEEKAVLGDFGLAHYPGKEALTKPGRKLGPMYYIAPEMLTKPDKADGRPADVYSLMKTLWVLGTGQAFPPQGEIRLDVPQVRLSTYINHPRAYLLDRIIEQATLTSPETRPSMQEVTDELRAWQNVRNDDPPPPRVVGILARIADLNERTFSNHKMWLEETNRVLDELRDRLRPISSEFYEGLGRDPDGVWDGDNRLGLLDIVPSVSSVPEPLTDRGLGFGVTVPTKTSDHPRSWVLPSTELRCSIGFSLSQAGTLTLGAAYVIADPRSVKTSDSRIIWSTAYKCKIGTAQQSMHINRILLEVAEKLPLALDEFATHLEKLFHLSD